MNEDFRQILSQAIGASDVKELETIQSLWSGYGRIARFALEGASIGTVVVKWVRIPNERDHPRGWNTDLSHQRKIRSYEVETAWYDRFASRCDLSCRVPVCYASTSLSGEVILVLEDMDAAGSAARRSLASLDDIKICLSWLAGFHARFMRVAPEGLWQKGTYWHLDTRPDELAALSDLPLKEAAWQIDELLEQCRFKTLVHGDAKLANFCFDDESGNVAAVDFQYVGGGCGMKDVVYFLGSCLNDTECERQGAQLLDHYFSRLRSALACSCPELDSAEVEKEWRAMYAVAWTDFHRFLKGWSPGHWKINSYSERLARQVVEGFAR